MAWIWLLIAGLSEIVWATGLKYTEGFSKLWPSVGTVVVMIASFVFLAQAMKQLPLGTAYTVWTGIGAVGTVLVGILLLGESKDPMRLLFVALIIAGILGVKMTGNAH
ncbi:quaternary ammonium compound efflux SMR transporter SugE [bacterium]|nr:quaternary ammonium compound efflux SMR transporter SugE [bacterium]